MMRSILAAVAVVFMALPAYAGDTGMYGGLFVLGGFTDSGEFERTPFQPDPIVEGDDPLGPSVGAGAWLGYNLEREFDIPLTLELSGNFRFRHDQDIAFEDVFFSGTNGLQSDVQTTDIMLSVLYPLPFQYGALQPYIGGGAGMVYMDVTNDSQLKSGLTAEDTSETNVAWQAQAGFTYPWGDNSELRFDYRYIDMGELSTGILPTGSNDEIKSNLTSHDLRFGVAWGF